MKNAFRFLVSELVVYKCRTGYAIAAVGPPINMAGDITSASAIRRRTITSVHPTPDAAVRALIGMNVPSIMESSNSYPVPDPTHSFPYEKLIMLGSVLQEMDAWTTS